MPRSRRSRKNQTRTEWGKNNPQTKAKNRKMLVWAGAIAIVLVAISAFAFIEKDTLFPPPVVPTATLDPNIMPLASPAGEYSPGGTKVLLMTTMGNITIQMRDDKPITTTNFVNLVKQGLYDGTLFHRVRPNFMIQGGGITTKEIPTIKDEIGNDNINSNGTIAMANTGAPDSASSQFFINVADNDNNATGPYNEAYTVFGKVIGGMDVVMKISQVPTIPNEIGENSQPETNIVVTRALVLK